MKSERQQKLLQLINGQVIETQEELTALLRGAGFDSTQATVSRDIKELGLTKIPSGGGRYRYAMPASPGLDRLSAMFRDNVISVEFAQNIVVVKTIPAHASAVCSELDAMTGADIVGTLAGDDTAFIVTRDTEAAGKLCARFRAMLRT